MITFNEFAAAQPRDFAGTDVSGSRVSGSLNTRGNAYDKTAQTAIKNPRQAVGQIMDLVGDMGNILMHNPQMYQRFLSLLRKHMNYFLTKNRVMDTSEEPSI